MHHCGAQLEKALIWFFFVLDLAMDEYSGRLCITVLVRILFISQLTHVSLSYIAAYTAACGQTHSHVA